jgi:hypothetical protein
MSRSRRPASLLSLLRALSVLGALALPACGDDVATDESGGAAEQVAPAPVVEAPPAPPPDRGPDGALLESDTYVGGLRLPRGLREVAVHERQHFFEGPYVPELYVRYFGPRLMTGQVDHLPNGAVRYVAATAREARGAVVVMDVLVSPGSRSRTLVTIDERPPVPTTPPPEAETLEAFRRAMESSD